MNPATTSFPPVGLDCADCGQPQYQTPSGPCCINGHGGADGIPHGPQTPKDNAAQLSDLEMDAMIEAVYWRWRLWGAAEVLEGNAESIPMQFTTLEPIIEKTLDALRLDLGPVERARFVHKLQVRALFNSPV